MQKKKIWFISLPQKCIWELWRLKGKWFKNQGFWRISVYESQFSGEFLNWYDIIIYLKLKLISKCTELSY